MKLTTHLHPVVRLRICEAMHPLYLNMSNYRTAESYRCVPIIQDCGPKIQPNIKLVNWPCVCIALLCKKSEEKNSVALVCELYRLSDSRLSAKLVQTFADRMVPRSKRGGFPTAVISVF
jgi:hypothetical protein